MRTAHLRVEHVDDKHCAALLEYHLRNRDHLAPWEPARPESFFTRETHAMLVRREMDEAARGAAYRFVAFESDPDRIVASISLHEIRRGVAQDAIVGYSVDAQRQGAGIATEAVGAVVAYAFDVLNLHRIHTSYQPSNAASARVLEKLGFRVEGRAKEQLFLNGAWQDGVLVALLNAKWKPV